MSTRDLQFEVMSEQPVTALDTQNFVPQKNELAETKPWTSRYSARTTRPCCLQYFPIHPN